MTTITTSNSSFFRLSNSASTPNTVKAQSEYKQGALTVDQVQVNAFSEKDDINWDPFFDAARAAGKSKVLYRMALQFEGEDRETFVNFISGLSADEIQKFYAATEKGGNIMEMIEGVTQVPEALIGNYFETVALVNGDTETLNNVITPSTDKEALFSALKKAGSNSEDFLKSMLLLSSDTIDVVSHFTNTMVQGKQLENYISFMKNADEKAINNVIDIASFMGETDKGNLLNALAYAGETERIPPLLNILTRYDQNGQDSEVSDFLSTAAHAEFEIATLLTRHEEIDFSYTSTLSVADTVNYLQAVSQSGESAEILASTGASLSEKNRSLFFYAASKEETNTSELMENVEKLKEKDLSSYLLQKANEGEKKSSDNIFVKGVLTDRQYQTYDAVSSQLNTIEQKTLNDIIFEEPGRWRSSLLNATLAANDNADTFITKYKDLSFEDQRDILNLSSDLNKEDRKNFIQAVISENGDLDGLIDTSRRIMENKLIGGVSARSVSLSHFLAAVGDADAEKISNLIQVANHIMNRNMPEKFLEEFDGVVARYDSIYLGNYINTMT